MDHSKYIPYHSDSDTDSGSQSESDSGSGSDTSSTEGFENNVANLPLLASALAKGFSLDEAANDTGDGKPPAATTATNFAKGSSALPPDLVTDQFPAIGFPIGSGPAASFSNLYITPDVSGNAMESSLEPLQRVILIDSRNRDRVAFPQPTNLAYLRYVC